MDASLVFCATLEPSAARIGLTLALGIASIQGRLYSTPAPIERKFLRFDPLAWKKQPHIFASLWRLGVV
jgi:hypothetical protein